MKLFLVMSLLSIAMLLLGALVGLAIKDLQITTDLYRMEQAYYLAEAGIVRAEDQYAKDPTWRGSLNEVSLGPGTYSVRVYDQSGSVKMESTGAVGPEVTKKVVVKKATMQE